MPLRLHIVHEADPRLLQRLDQMYSATERAHRLLEHVIATQGDIMATIKELVASVAAVRGEADSIGALITQLREQITGLTNVNLPADVQAQVDQAFADAEAAKAELASAVTTNPATKSAPSAPADEFPAPGTVSPISVPDSTAVPTGNPNPGMPFPNPPMPATGDVTKTDGVHT